MERQLDFAGQPVSRAPRKRKTNRITLDEVLTPFEVKCAICKGEAIIYPTPEPNGTCICRDGCSPKWLEPFTKFYTNKLRKSHNLEELE